MSQRRQGAPRPRRTGGQDASSSRPGPPSSSRPSTNLPLAEPRTPRALASATAQSSDYDQLINSFNALQFDPSRPLRPGYGTAGRAITLKANFFHLRGLRGPIFDYAVEIRPKPDSNRLKARIFDLLEMSDVFAAFMGHIAHDGNQRLVSAQKLPQPLDIVIPFCEDGEAEPRPGATVYTISIIFTGELDVEALTKYLDGDVGSRDYNTLPIISALNLVLQQHAAKTGVRVGKNRYFFPASSEAVGLSLGVIAIPGFTMSVRPTCGGLMVNVNTCMTAFIRPGNLAKARIAFSGNSNGAMPTLPKALAKCIKVTTHHTGRKMRRPIKAIATPPPETLTSIAKNTEGKFRLVQYSFLANKRAEHGITLEHAADLPVVDIGSAAGQPYRGKLNDVETAQMIRAACKPPRANAEAITRAGLPMLGLSPQRSPVDGFGLEIPSEMTNTPARELTSAGVTYGRGETASVVNGSWNSRNVVLHRGAAVDTCWVLVVRDGHREAAATDPAVKGLVAKFGAKLQRYGLTIPGNPAKTLVTPSLQRFQDASREAALAEIRNVITGAIKNSGNKKPGFILVLLTIRDNFIYPGIKRLGDVDLGIHTIHMQLNKALGDERKQDQYLSNVWQLEASAMEWLRKETTMMVGIDVTHPGPTSRVGAPSIAAVVASVDVDFVQFPASLRIQKPDANRESKEMVTELRDMLVERLLWYERKNNALPERIIVFRDGVSGEGQFDIVVREEKTQILEAFQKISTESRGPQPYRPLVAIIICGKRHNARFFDPALNKNTIPGTVVDKGVTAVFDFDFYLQAHAGIQGTVKSTHYTVVYEEFKLGADELQEGSNWFSHLYARATRVVSLVPAAYYADLACERGRYYLNDFMVDDKTTSSGRGNFDREEEKARVFDTARGAWGEGIHPDLRDSMFYI
ncbi:Piwi domain-containing protein [Mycena capillaripes]|nr:Piwi domain-containing protein [Mycena capillaripes]